MRRLTSMIMLVFLSLLLVSPAHVSSNQPLTYLDIPALPQLEIQQDNEFNCSVTCDFILPVLPPDAIRSIDNPKFISVAEAELEQEQFVLGVVYEGVAQAFPLDILDWHEIVNTQVNGRNIAVTYCPLTATGIHYDRDSIGGGEIGVSGRLYENNLVFYDRDTDQYWLQMYGEVIQGDNETLGRQIDRLPIVETTWRAWKAMYPDTQVLSRDTGIYSESQYDKVAYAGYDTREDTRFRSSYQANSEPDNLYSRKSRALILTVGDVTKLYPLEQLSQYSVINDVINSVAVTVVFDELNRLAIPFSSALSNGTIVDNFVQSPTDLINNDTFGLPVFTDSTGSLWNFKGEAFDGPLAGEKLQQLSAYTGYWFAAVVMYRDAEIFPQDIGREPIPNDYNWANRLEESSVDSSLQVGLAIAGIALVATIALLVRWRLTK